MNYCFVYAPLKKRWAGELLLAHHDENEIDMDDVEQAIKLFYPREKWESLVVESNAPLNRVEQYMQRREEGKLQRMTASGTYEEIHVDEWIKAVGRHYPHAAIVARYLLNV